MTANQINYLRGREDKRHNEAVEAETRRVNNIQAELRRVDQELQRDLNAINAKYRELQYQLDRDLFELQTRRTERELAQKDRDLTIREQANAINWSNIQIAQDRLDLDVIRQKEQERANRVAEQQKQSYIHFEQTKLPGILESQHLSNAFTREQIKTERTRDDLNSSQIFRNYFNAGIDAINSIFKVATPLLVAK